MKASPPVYSVINGREKSALTELGLECRLTFGDSLPAEEDLKLMQALFSECTLLTWLAGFSNGSKVLCVLWTLTFLSSGIVSRCLITESIPWQFRVDIFVTHIWKIKEMNWGLFTETSLSLDVLFFLFQCSFQFQEIPKKAHYITLHKLTDSPLIFH